MAFIAPFIAAAGSMMASAGAAVGTAAAGTAAAAGGTAAAAAAGAATLWGAGAGAAAAAGAGTAAAASGGILAGLTAGEMAALGLTAAGIGTTMLSKPPEMKMPFQDRPQLMPDADDDAIRKTKERAMVAQQQRQGRASTMLSTSYDKLG